MFPWIWLIIYSQKFSSGTCIPQRLFRQGAAIPDGATGEVIMFAMFDGKCFPATLALAGKCSLLVDEDTVPSFTKKHHLINLRIEVFVLHVIPSLLLISFLRIQWPGYHGWEAQVSTVSPRRTVQFSYFLDKNRGRPGEPERDYSCEISEGDR